MAERSDVFRRDESLVPHNELFLWCPSRKTFVGKRMIEGLEDSFLYGEVVTEFFAGHYYTICQSDDDRTFFRFKLRLRCAELPDLVWMEDRLLFDNRIYWVKNGDYMEGPHRVPEHYNLDRIQQFQRAISSNRLYIIDQDQEFQAIYKKAS